MGYTPAGCLAFIALMISTAGTSHIATRLIMSAYGRAPRDWRMIPAVSVWTALVIIAGTVFMYAEPKP